MPTVHMDLISTLEMEEEFHCVTRLVKKVRITGMPTSLEDHRILSEALLEAGVPSPGDGLTSEIEPTFNRQAFANLVLTKRSVRVIERTTVEAILTFEHFLNEGQDLDDPFFGEIVGEVSVSVQQVESNTDANGNLITVQHAFPNDDPDFANQTKVQGGTISYFQPITTLRFRGIKKTTFPRAYARSLIGKVNSGAWGGRGAREWLVVGCQYLPFDFSQDEDRHMFSFELQHNPDTWDPTVVFIDDRTGRPPAGLVAGVGFKTVEKHPAVDFEQAIGAAIQGG